MRKFVEILIVLLVVSITTVFLSIFLWQALLWVSAMVSRFDLSIGLVGNPQSVDPGAVVVALVFLALWLFSAWRSVKYGKPHVAYTFVLMAPVSAFIAFVQISSLAWY